MFLQAGERLGVTENNSKDYGDDDDDGDDGGGGGGCHAAHARQPTLTPLKIMNIFSERSIAD